MNSEFNPQQQLFRQIYNKFGEDGYDIQYSDLEDLITLVIQKGLMDSSEDVPFLKSVSLQSYLDFLSHKTNLNNQIVSDSIIESYLSRISETSKLKLHFPEGYRVFLVPLPFSNTANPLSSDQIQKGEAFKVLITKNTPNAKVEIGEVIDSYITSILPKKIVDLSFVVPKYENSNILEISENDQKVIKELFLKSAKELQNLLS